MSKGIRFTDEFKKDAVAQVVDRGYAVIAVEIQTNNSSGRFMVASGCHGSLVTHK